nr:uncharacterized protein LOC116432309 [Nomia melanderi]
MLVFTLLTLLFCVWIQTRDIYYTWGDFSACTYVACNIMCLNIALFKILILVVHKQKFLNLIRYMEKHFWHTNYTLYELAILARWKRICIYFISSFTFFTETANVSYTVIPIIGTCTTTQG